MSNFSFMLEIEVEQKYQKRLQEFCEYAKNAEISIYSRGTVAKNYIREATEIICEIICNMNNVRYNEKGLSYYAKSEEIKRFLPEAYTMVQSIEQGCREESLKDGESLRKLLKTLQKLTLDLYKNLGGESSAIVFKEEYLEKSNATVTDKSYVDSANPVLDVLNDITKEYTIQQTQSVEQNNQYVDALRKIQETNTLLLERMKKLEDKIEYKDEFEKQIMLWMKKIVSGVSINQSEIKRGYGELSEKILCLQQKISYNEIGREDILSKMVLLFARMDNLEKKQDGNGALVKNLSENLTANMQKLMKENEKHYQQFGRATKMFFAGVEDSIKTIRKITQDCQEQIAEIKKESKKRRNTKIPHPKPAIASPTESSSRWNYQQDLEKVIELLKWHGPTIKHKLYSAINLIWVIMAVIWIAVFYVFQSEQPFLDSLFVSKILGLFWYFGTWFLHVLAVMSVVVAVFRSLAGTVVSLYTSRTISARIWKASVKILIVSFVLLVLGKYVKQGFYVYMQSQIGWRNILLSDNARQIVYWIQASIEHWRING